MPKGIPYIIGNEAAERFSFYGMKTILIIFMTEYLLMGENKGTIWVHTFVMAAYFLPLIGGLISDIFWGKYKTIIRLSLFYCLGHGVLALYESQETLALGLAFIALGAGGIKSCVSAHVGDQFNKDNSDLLERVFGYFYISINVGATLSTLLTPLLMQLYGPSIAFGVPGILMLVATITFWMGRKKFIAIPPVGWKKFKEEVLTANGIRIILKLCVVYLFVSVFWSLFDQTASTWVLQAKRTLMDRTINLGFFQFELLPDQVQSINPILIVTLAPIFSFFIYPLVNRFFKLTYLRKISLGLFIAALSFVVIGWIEGQMEQGIGVHVGWQLLAFFFITTAEVLVSITTLEFSYTQAPNAMKSLVMGFFWLSVTLGNLITAQVNEFILRDVQLQEVTTGEKTTFTIASNKEISSGLKLEVDNVKDVKIVKIEDEKSDTIPFSGTFVIGDVKLQGATDNELLFTFDLLDINKVPVQTANVSKKSLKQTIWVNKLKGSDYFYFFVYLMLGTALVFVFVTIWYKEERYIQEHPIKPGI